MAESVDVLDAEMLDLETIVAAVIAFMKKHRHSELKSERPLQSLLSLLQKFNAEGFDIAKYMDQLRSIAVDDTTYSLIEHTMSLEQKPVCSDANGQATEPSILNQLRERIKINVQEL